MISYLAGAVINKQEKSLILDVNGVGYGVFVPAGLLEKVSEGQDLKLFVHTNVREDDISLYGFETNEAWQFFRLLLTVSGIGPRSALEILNAPMPRVKNAIAKKDAAFLTKVPGIGKKTAERIIVDLQGKIKEEALEESAEETAPAINDEIVQALVSLGYHRQQVMNGLKKIPSELTNEEAIIKYFLQNI